MQSGEFVMMTRFGFAVRGLLYLVVAVLVIESGRAADVTAALQYVEDGAGRWMLVLVALGLGAYGLWRLASAAVGRDGANGSRQKFTKRAGAAISGVVHLFLAYQAVQLMQKAARISSDQAQEHADTVLDMPGGEILMAVGAAVLLVAGAMQLVKAGRCSFLDPLDSTVANTPGLKWLGRIGYASRGVIFLISAWLLAQTALTGQSWHAGGMDRALEWLSSPTNLFVAAGLGLFGLFSLVEARYRRIHAPRMDEVVPAGLRGGMH